MFGEAATAKERNVKCSEVILVNASKVGVKSLIGRHRWPALDSEWNVVGLSTERKLGDQSNRLNAGQGSDARFELLEEVSGFSFALVLLLRQFDTQR